MLENTREDSNGGTVQCKCPQTGEKRRHMKHLLLFTGSEYLKLFKKSITFKKEFQDCGKTLGITTFMNAYILKLTDAQRIPW